MAQLSSHPLVNARLIGSAKATSPAAATTAREPNRLIGVGIIVKREKGRKRGWGRERRAE
jgi:hypothetical protein